MHAGAADLDHVVADAGQPRQLEFVLGIQLRQLPRPVRRQHAVGADHLAAGVVLHQQVIAVGVVVVAVDAFGGGGQLRAHLGGKHLVAQLLRAADILVAARQSHAQPGGGADRQLFAQLHAAFLCGVDGCMLNGDSDSAVSSP
ncbi:hypothetical protein D3C72_1896450 [compost metagenome]